MVALVALGTIVSGCRPGPGSSAASGASPSSARSGGTASGDPDSGDAGSGVPAGILSASNPFASPATSLGPHDPTSGPPADPFAGTPAEHWANGAAGIAVPAAHLAGPFSAGQVAAAYAMTRKLLIAQNLDRKTLLGGYPAAFADLLTAEQRKEFLAGLNKTGVAKNGDPLSTRDWVVSFAPGTTTLVGDVIKVHGTMSARAAKYQGYNVLDVDINYRFVYAVQPPHQPQDWMRVVGRLHGYVEFFNWANPGGTLQPWVRNDPGMAGGKCGTTDGYTHPDFPGNRPAPGQPSEQPTGTPIDPYSMANPEGPGNCQAITGT
jgi:hypothetical protein